MSALCETVQIVNKRGLHARASAKFVNMVAELPDGLDIRVSKDGVDAAGGSILGLMMLGAGPGTEVEIAAVGREAEEAINVLGSIVENRFDEDD